MASNGLLDGFINFQRPRWQSPLASKWRTLTPVGHNLQPLVETYPHDRSNCLVSVFRCPELITQGPSRLW